MPDILMYEVDMSERLVAGPRRGTLVVEARRCHGCQACMVTCSLVHEGKVMPRLARIRVALDLFEGDQVIHYCHQCRRAPCANHCPQRAIYWHAEGGYWAVDAALCNGCGACIEACPFGAMVLDSRVRETGLRVAVKCDTCEGQPACVASCPSGALAWQEEKVAIPG
jgi:carbon-monoxide dehydrogenase iron sulfur subunit